MKHTFRPKAAAESAALLLSTFAFVLLTGCSNPDSPSEDDLAWKLVESNHGVRHEAGLVAHNNSLVLMGGRRDQAIEHYDLASNTWQQHFTPSQELHHFQPVSFQDEIYIIGALTGKWPEEDAVDHVLIYNPSEDALRKSHPIPAARKRGAAGLVEYNGELYMLGGLTNGHMGGSVPWFDRYNPKTGEWVALADAPTARDHFQAVVVDNKLYAMAGRQTSHATGEGMSLTQAQVDVFDFVTQTWSTLPADKNIAVPRAGNMAIALGQHILIGGGESTAQKIAHNEVNLFDTRTQTWTSAPTLNLGRHGTGFGIIDDTLITVSGSGNAGGAPELNSLEHISVSGLVDQYSLSDAQKQSPIVIAFGRAIEVNILGKQVSESDEINPFVDYLMEVEFTHESGTVVRVEGYFAGDGDAANSGADSGQVWRTKFTPQLKGTWQYRASLYEGSDVVLASQELLNESTVVNTSEGSFIIGESEPNAGFFATNGQVDLKDGYFYFPHTDKYWIKVGSNSPENFLSFHEIDGTYRASQQAREGEAKAPDYIHEFEAHLQDWREGDAIWQAQNGSGKGKGIIGAVNYLADMGMQSQYFLSMNIDGDGRDVWPYTTHDEFERFDISKLDQWDMVFSHLQRRGMLLHVVTQETENELLLDGGNTERLRKLYYRELIARFGYHNGLIWNLGEENGPAQWSPNGQTDEQRIAMAAYFAKNDPHNNPVFLHTLPSSYDKDQILPPVFNSDIDAISFQVDNRETVFAEILKWRALSKENNVNDGQGWPITMDEIGTWQIGAMVDADDPNHDEIRRHALWGALLAGATGVEWYFGAHQPHNDLSSEDFRVRENLWRVTRIAADYFNALHSQQISIADLTPHAQASSGVLYEASINAQRIAYVLDTSDRVVFDVPSDVYQVQWMDPITGTRTPTQNTEANVQGVLSISKPQALSGRDAVVSILPIP
ncbi:DUF5060 domain-containing protein [Ningiella sp. W23]|uniref:Kelch repeat-containing protein n=1 Tax=Ningiella sp. W23 TaxID=3023715 RepID=UPI00375788E4